MVLNPTPMLRYQDCAARIVNAALTLLTAEFAKEIREGRK